MRILYVEDNATDAELVRATLAKEAPDSSLELAATYTQALARLARSGDLDVVLCDLYLPDGTGLELLAHVRARGLPLAVVILTGGADQDAVVAALKAGADAYLIKHKDPLSRLPQTLAKALAHFHATPMARMRPLKLLYAEGDAADVDLTRRHLAQHAPHIHPDAVASAAEVLARLPAQAGAPAGYDVLLLNDRLPDQDALELIQVLRGERGLTLPVVLVTDQGSEELAAQALQLGVADYLSKHPGYLHELPAALEVACRKAELVSERGALMESETRIRLLLDSTAEAIFGIDLDGRCTFVNPACLRVLGYERAEELLAQHIHELTHHSHADGSPYPQETCRIYRAYRDDTAVHCDSEVFWRRDGSAVPVEYWSYPMHRGGRVVGAVVTFFDIGERRRDEEKLRQAAMVFEHTRDGVMITDLQGHILTVNPAFSEITGYGEAEVRGQGMDLLGSGRHGPEFFQAMWAGVREAGYWQGEIWNRRKNGEPYLAWLTLSTVRDAGGAPTHYVGVATDINQLRRSQEQLDHLAHYDLLTELPNRTLMLSRLGHALDRAHRHDQRVGVLYLDLDHFKTVNDSLGHEAGDALLCAVVARFQGRVRQEDTLARMGGDQFLLLLEQLDTPEAAAAVARDLLAVLAPPFKLADGHEIYLGASIGISIHPDDAASGAEMLRNAEVAMYQTKAQERNQFCFYTGDMNAGAVARLELEAALRRALERDELELHYQPKVDLQSGRMTGAEALLRWQRDGRDQVPPAQFIPLAEKTGLIVALGAWVIDAACRQMRAWSDEGLTGVRVAVNVSARQFRAAELDRTVAQALQRYGIPPQQLELELTESMLMADPDGSAAVLDRLKAVGVKLSLDDFGTGYSSFTYLSRFPIDALKIDQSFVRDITRDPDAAGIVSAIIGLAQRMHLQVVAEGVESEAQLGYLRTLGCDLMQGYLFSKPLPTRAFTELLRADRTLPAPHDAATGQRTLLLVDDEPQILKALRRMLRHEGYRILSAESARAGLELLAQHPVQVILSDQRMPEMSGTEFLGRVKDLHPDTIRIVLSGYAELETIIQAVNQGAIYKFLIKPWDDDLLRGHLRDAFRYHEAIFKPRAAPAGIPGEGHSRLIRC